MNKVRLIFCLIVFATARVLAAETNQLSADDRRALLVATNFHAVTSVANLPPAVRKLCGGMAEPGQKWQETDVIEDESLLSRRLIWAFTDGKYYVVHYERGGIGHSYHVQVVKMKEGNVESSYGWYGFALLKNYHGFLAQLQKGTLTASDE